MRFFLTLISIILFCNVSTAQKKHALLIGLSEYKACVSNPDASWSTIHGANDVRLLAPLLKRQHFSVTRLTNSKATSSAIKDSFLSLSKNVHQGDLVYIHLSGHGQAFEDFDGDEADGWDESFAPYDSFNSYLPETYSGEKHLLDDDLNQYLVSIRKKCGTNGMVYVVIDACHSGSSYRGEEEDTVFVRGTSSAFSPNGKRYAPRISTDSNYKIDNESHLSPICLIEACRSYECNTEIKQEGEFFGPLSYYISRMLLTSPLSADIIWLEKLRSMMDKDTRLIRQHIVIEKTKK